MCVCLCVCVCACEIAVELCHPRLKVLQQVGTIGSAFVVGQEAAGCHPLCGLRVLSAPAPPSNIYEFLLPVYLLLDQYAGLPVPSAIEPSDSTPRSFLAFLKAVSFQHLQASQI